LRGYFWHHFEYGRRVAPKIHTTSTYLVYGQYYMQEMDKTRERESERERNVVRGPILPTVGGRPPNWTFPALELSQTRRLLFQLCRKSTGVARAGCREVACSTRAPTRSCSAAGCLGSAAHSRCSPTDGCLTSTSAARSASASPSQSLGCPF